MHTFILLAALGMYQPAAADDARLHRPVPGRGHCAYWMARTPGGKPQDLLIISPAPDSEAPMRSQLRFEGSAFDIDDGVLLGDAISWRSDRDGFLGTGVMLRTSALSAGIHRITMSATDSEGNVSSATITLRVVAPRSD